MDSAPVEPFPQIPIASISASSEIWSGQYEANLPSAVLGSDYAIGGGKSAVSARQLYGRYVETPSSDIDLDSGATFMLFAWLSCIEFSECKEEIAGLYVYVPGSP